MRRFMFNKIKNQIDAFSNRDAFGFTLVVSAYLLFTISIGNEHEGLNLRLILLCILFCFVLTKIGELVLRVSHLTQLKAQLPAAFVIGFSVVSVLTLAISLLFSVSAIIAFSISAVFILSLNFLVYKPDDKRPAIIWYDIPATLVFSVAVGGLIMVPVSSATTLLDTGVFTLWEDYYVHGLSILAFDSNSLSVSLMEVAGENLQFYHYASFVMTAVFQPVTNMSGLALSTSVLLPLGVLTGVLGSYVYAVELGGRLGGLMAVAALICLPMFAVFFQSGWYDFYWLLLIAPGSGYAVGVGAIVCALVTFYFSKLNRRVLWLAMALLFSLILIRAHFFLLIAPAIVSVVAFHHWRANIRLLLLFICCAAAGVILALILSEDLYNIWQQQTKSLEYLSGVENGTLFNGKRIDLINFMPSMAFVLRILIVLTSICGAYIVLYPIVLGARARSIGLTPADAIPLLILLCFVGLLLFSPIAKNNDVAEYKHRHFLFLYVVFAIHTIAPAVNLALRTIVTKYSKVWICSLVFLVFGTTFYLNWGENPSQPDLETEPWASSYHNQSITPGIIEVSQYIKSHAQLGDIMARSIQPGSSLGIDNIIKVSSLTGIPIFSLGRTLMNPGSLCIQNLIKSRLDIFQILSSKASWDGAQKFLKSNGIRWFIVLSGEILEWDPNRTAAIFSSHGISLYDAGHPDKSIFNTPKC
jgi:hypothetical protein